MSSDQPGRGADDDRTPGTEVRDLLGVYALDAVDDVERRAVERLVASDPDAARELAGLTATAAMLGTAVAERPPTELRAAVLSAITRTPQVAARASSAVRGATSSSTTAGEAAPAGEAASTGEAAPTGEAASTGEAAPVRRLEPRSRAPRRATWLAIAATAIGAAAIPSGIAWQQTQQNHRVEAQARAVADLLADPSAQVVRGDVTGGGAAVGVLTADQALFTATGLEDLDAGKVYQLWVLRDGKPLPAGLMPDDDGRVRAVTDDFTAGDSLAVTVEPSGGSKQPTTSPVVVLASA